jgi:GAF domain-containing protein/HAMP domain-containing protein
MGKSAQQISTEALRTQAEEYLRQITVGDAQRNDLVLKRAQRDAENVAQYATAIFEKPDTFTGAAYWQAEDHMFVGPDGQYLNDETDVSSAFAPNFVDIDEELLTALELSAYSDFILVPTYESDPNTVAIYLSTDRETIRYHPNINLGMVVPPDFQITQRPWYLSANPENNPERAVVWSPVYADATGKGLMVTAAAPIYVSGDEFIGAIGIDLTLDDIRASVEAARSLSGGYSLLIDDTGYAIALPERGYQDILGRPAEPGEVGADLSEITTEFAPVVAEMITGSAGFDTLEVGGRELFVAYAPLESTGWSMANVAEASKVLQAVGALQEELETSTESLVLARILPVGIGILAVVLAIGFLSTNRLVGPIRRLATAAQRIGAGQWDTPLPRAGNDEIGALSQSFATMVVQLRELMESLERRVADRTRDLARRAVQLEAAAEVARDATAIRDVDELLDETVRLISERFGFYHAGVFLVDDAHEYAVLQAASSEGGRRMLERGHKLAVGRVGMVGYVTGTGEPRIALDVGEDAVHFVNPDLPETRSEMALPLHVRGEVIGALDVQSTEPGAFSDEDVSTLQTMADQLAVALDNARLLEQTQTSLREVEALYGDYSREAWGALTRTGHVHGYTYDRVSVSPVAADRPAEVQQALREGHIVAVSGGDGRDEAVLAVPISVRGKVTGVLNICKSGEAAGWTPEEMALAERVSDQLGLALESARLYQDTQRRAAREQLTGEVTARMRETLDMDTVLQTAIREFGDALGIAEVEVRMGEVSKR